MKKNQNTLSGDRYTAHMEKAPSKPKAAAIICSAVALILISVFMLMGFSGCSGNGSGDATGDEVPTTILNIDEESFVFAEGIYIGEAAVGGRTYKEAREIAEGACDSMIHDFTLTVKARNESFEYNRQSFSWDTNVEDVLLEAAAYSESLTDSDTNATSSSTANKEKTFELSFEVNSTSVEEAVAAIAAEVDVAAKNATIGEADSDDVSIVRDSAGYKVEQASLVKEMVWEIDNLSAGNKNSAEIKAKVTEIQPTLTYDDLDGKIVLLASYSTYSNNTEEGCKNMAIAMNKCNGSVIEPGETWSFSAHAGNTNSTAAGYLSATVISNGEYTQGIGGGVCQASTTIYGAAIRTNMVIAERHNHYYKSSYADAGLDATIAYPTLDMKLKNPTDYPMYLQCYMSGRTLYCNIYGWQDPSFDEVEIHAYTHDENPSKNYYLASAYRVFLKDGKEVSREDLPSSRYHYTSGEVEEETTKATEKPKTTKPAKPQKPAATEAATVAPIVTAPQTPTTATPIEPDPVEPTAAVTPDADPTEAVTP